MAFRAMGDIKSAKSFQLCRVMLLLPLFYKKACKLRLIATITQKFLPLGGALLVSVLDCDLNCTRCTALCPLWILDRDVGILVQIRSVLVLFWGEVDSTSWKRKLASSLNVLGTRFRDCSKAIPSMIH